MNKHLSFFTKWALVSCLVLLFSFTTWAETKTFKSGSFIINMGVVPQTVANGLRPYGMIYNLLRAQNVPVYWVINQNKIKDGTDFTYNGVAYKGGTFIIDGQNRTAAVNAIISSWVSSGVVGNTTTSELTVDVTYKLNVAPRWTLDSDNGKVAAAYLTAAGINNTTFPGAYNWRLPSTLDCCDDLYVMPHADPTWATHGRLYSWNKDCLGSIWAACHAVSALENSINPNNTAQQLNFLCSRTNTVSPTPWPNNSLLLWTNHSGGSVPYTTRLATDPVAQYMGTTDAALLNGAEQIYMPLPGSTARWNAGANIISYDPSQANVPTLNPDLRNAAALIVYGRGFDSLNRGYVMYEAGHNVGGTGTAQVAAQRAFFNFSFLQSMPKSPQITVTGITSGTIMEGGTTMSGLSASATSPLPGVTFTYQWISTCGGTFSNPTGSTTSFTAPTVGSLTTCNVTCKITDNCGRTSFQTVDITVTSGPTPPVANDDVINVPNGCNPGPVSINVLKNDTDPQSSPITFDSLVSITASPTDAGTWSSTPDGVVTFTPAENFSGVASIDYVIHNSFNLSSTGTLTVYEGGVDANGCFPNSVYAVDQEIHATMLDITSSSGILYGSDSLALDDHEMTFTTAATSTNTDADYVNFGTAGTNFAVFDLGGLQLRFRDTIAIYWSKGATGTATMTVDVATSANGPWTNSQVYTLSTSGTGSAVATVSNFAIPDNVSGITHFRVRAGSEGTASAVNVWIDGNHIKYLNCISRVPRTGNDNITILEDLPTVMNVLSNDVDVDGGGLTLHEIVGAPSKGHVSINLDNTITYVNNTDVSGVDTFYYKVCDDAHYCNTGRVIVTITEDDCPVGQYKPIAGGGTSTAKVFQSGFSGTDAATANGTTSNFRDGGIRSDRATKNYGSTTTVEIGRLSKRRGIFYFNVSEIPSNAIIEEAVFSLWRTGGSNNYNDSVRLFSLTNSFNETQATWNNRQSGTAWTTPGGDFNATAVNARLITSTNTRFFWNAATMVQSWVSNSANNLGFLIRTAETIDSRHIFGTRENSTLSMRPMLTVTYLEPGICTAIVNRAPMAVPTNVTTNSTTAVTIPVLNNCSDPDGNTVSLQAAISATNGTAVKSGNNIIFTPTSGFNGVATVTFSISDGSLHDTTKLYIDVTNSAPIANNDFPVPAASNTPQTSDVGLNDADPENATLVYALYQNGKNGTATISGSEITYTPNAGFTGTDTLYYEITESGSGCVQGFKDSAYVVFTVNNQAPTSTIKSGITLPCQPVTINLIDGAVDGEGDALEVNSISALSNPSAGTLTNNNDGTVTFTSTPGFSGTVSFDYTLRDNGEPPLVSSPSTVTFNVTVPTNTAPIAGDDWVDTIKTGQIAYWSILDNDSDPNGNTLSLPAITVAAQHGTASILANGLLKYIPNSGYFGVDSVTYQLCDSVYDINCNVSQDLCTTAKAYFYVEPLNTVEGVNDENSTWINTAVSGEVLNNDFDKEGDTPLIFNGYVVNGVGVSSGTITVSGILNDGTPVSNCGTLTIGTNGTYTFTPANGFVGIMRVPYALQDARDNAALDTAMLRITVTPLPDDTNSIIANNDENTSYGNPVYGNVLVNDADPQSHSFNVTAYQYDSDGDGIADASGTLSSAISVGGVDINGLSVTNAGTMTLTANGTYTFTPSSGFYGRVNMTYNICDNTTPQACTMADITIDVLQDINGPANDAPVAGDDFTVTVVNVAKTGNFIGNDSDPNSNPVSISGVTINPAGSATAIGTAVTTTQGGTVQFYANGTYLYTPPTNYTGADRVTYTICDVTVVEPQPLCTEATIHMLIAPSAPLPPCDTPMNAAVVYSLDSATFSWTHAEYADSVQLNYRIKNTGSWTRVSVVGESYTIYSLAPASTYEYYLRSYCTNALADTSIVTTTKEFTTPAKNTVLGVNDENSTWVDVPVSGTILNNDKDPEGDYPITFNGYMVNGVAITSGTFTVSGVDANGDPVSNAGTITIGTNGSYTFTPASSFVGVVSVPYALQDDGATVAHDTAVLSITVSPLPYVSNSLIANNDENISYGDPVNGNVVLNDADPQADNFSVSSYQYDSNGDGTPDATGTLSSGVTVGGVDADGNPTANAGTMNLTSNGTYTFTPANGFSGRVTMQYTICDTVTPPACTQATITIDVLEDLNGPSNDPPLAGDDFAVTPKNVPVSGNFIGNDSDPNSDSVSVLGVTINPAGPATPIDTPITTVHGGTIQFYANGTYLYTPPTGYTGPDRVAYTICDVTLVEPQPLCAEATIHLLVAETSCDFPITVTPTDAACFGGNGSLAFSANGGTGTITFTVNGDTTTSPLAAIAGTYTVVATDVNGCSTSVVSTISEPASAVSLTASATDPACHGGNGSLSFSATGGTGTITYTVNDTVRTSPYTTKAGTYTIVATDANNCTTSEVRTISEPSALVLTTSKTDASCHGGNGSLIFSATGGTGTIWYTVNGTARTSPYDTIAGSYLVIAVDAEGCATNTVVTISQPTALDLLTAVTDPLCKGDLGSLEFDATGGTGTISYTVNGTTQSSPYNAVADTYTIVATDANSCSISSVLTIDEPLFDVTLYVTATNALCNGGLGTIEYTALGGTGIVVVTVNGDVESSPFNTYANTYTVIANDANGCTTSTVAIITDPATAVDLSASANDALCFGGTGSLTFSATGGTGTIAYTVNGNTESSPFTGTADTYTIVATDANSCSVSAVRTISEPAASLSFTTVSVDDASCNGGSGLITFAASGGSGTIAYTVNGNTETSPFSGTADTYTIVATDANSCSISTVSTISEPTALDLLTAVTDPLCKGDLGSLEFDATGGTGTISYTVNGTTQSSPYNAVADTYTIVATDANSCSISSVLTIDEPLFDVTLYVTATNALCNGGLGTIEYTALGGTGIVVVTVNGDVESSPFNTYANTYTVIANDANGCTTSTVAIITDPVTAVDLSASANDALCFGGTGSLTFSATGGTGTIAYTVNGNTESSPFTGTADTYTIVATDANSCSVSAVRTISEPAASLSFTTVSVDDASCNGGSGLITFAASGGSGTIAYTVNGNTETSPFSGTADTYTIVATDANSCSISTVSTISEPAAIVLTASASDATCGSGNGSLTFSATGGEGSITYTVNGTSQTSPYSAPAATYTIVATDANNCSISTVATISQPTPTNNGCSMPTTISTPTITYNAVYVNFTKAASATTTQVQIRVKGSQNWGTMATSTSVAHITGLTGSTTYEYRLRSRCSSVLYSDYTCIQEFTTPATPPSCLAPTVTGEALCGTQFRISWTAPSYVSSYTLQFKQSANVGWSTNVMTRTFNSATSMFTFLTAWPGTWYTYRMRTNCTPGTLTANSTWSAEGTLLTPGVRPPNATLTNEINDFNDNWVFYPNPTNNILNIAYTSYADDEVSLFVMDMTGRILQQIKTQAVVGDNQTQINIGELPSGIYTIKAVQGGESKMVGKVTKE